MLLYFTLSIGAILILCGFYCEKYPRMISGISTMSEEKLQNVDLKSLGKFIKKGLITIGVLFLVVSGIFYLYDLEKYIPIAQIAILLVGITILVTISTKYDHNPKSTLRKYSSSIILLLIGLTIGIVLFIGSRTTEVVVSKNEITITGLYGTTLKTNDIAKVELLDSIPKITIRSNGFDDGMTKKGNFKLKGMGKALLFIQKPIPPYLYMELENKQKIIYSAKNAERTNDIYTEIIETIYK